MDWTWGEVARIAGGGFGVTILVLVIMSIAIWVMGLVIQKLESEGDETK